MTLEKNDIAKIANLARLHLTDDEKGQMQGALNNFLNWVEELQNVNTDGVIPLESVIEQDLYLREDEINHENISADILKNGADTKDIGDAGFFIVPKVVE